MTFKPCLVIPVYNHGTLLAATLERLQTLQLHCIIVDDGSNDGTVEIIKALVDGRTDITLIEQTPNQGKGAAVLRGIAQAHHLGFSHAMQVDADGQHTIEDIPKMLAMAEAEPEALISGVPVYDASVPKSRLYGRYITHFWVWVETLSFSIKDTMCGFRVYPIAVTNDLANSHPLSQRMDFDIDVMVRLYWRSVPFRFLETRVVYPEGGISHFSVWQDNLMISRMHARLVGGMLLRLPKLIKNKFKTTPQAEPKPNEASHWSEVKESGAYFGLWFSLMCYRVLGPKALRLMLYPIISYFFLSNKAARAHSKKFLQRVHDWKQNSDKTAGSNNEHAKPPSLKDSFNHFMNFGNAIIDRFRSWTDDFGQDNLQFEDRQDIYDCIAKGRGGVILGSHLGNVEICRALADKVPELKMNVLAFHDNSAQIKRLMKNLDMRVDMEIIEVSSVDPSTAMLLNDKIQNGEFVVVNADRTSPTAMDKSLSSEFLGHPAAFPQGAFILAGLLQCPVFLLFCLRQPKGPSNIEYHVYLEHFSDNMVMPRRQRMALLQGHIDRYAQRLQHYALMAPQQWYNFYDFWLLPPKLQQDVLNTKVNQDSHKLTKSDNGKTQNG